MQPELSVKAHQQRVGAVLVLAGLANLVLSVAWAVWLGNGSWAANFGCLLVGIVLIFCNLRVARWVRWLLIASLVCLVSMAVAVLFFQPLGLTWLQWRTQHGSVWLVQIIELGWGALVFWAQRELGRGPMPAAMEAAHLRRVHMAWPVLLGLVMGGASLMFSSMLLRGEDAGRALAMARQTWGDGYRYQVSAVTVTRSPAAKIVQAQIVVWNDEGWRLVPVAWRE